jgi:hypothetical protein
MLLLLKNISSYLVGQIIINAFVLFFTFSNRRTNVDTVSRICTSRLYIQEGEMEWIYQFFGPICSILLIWGIPIHDEDDEIMQLWIRGQGPKPKGPTALGECKFTAARWPRFSTWMLDYHSHPGVMSRTWKSKAKFHDDFTKVLKKTGEQDGWWMHHFVVEYFCFL